MKNRPVLIVILFVILGGGAIIALMAKDDDNKTSTNNSQSTPLPSPTPQTSNPPSSSQSATGSSVSIQNMAFTAASLTVKKGVTVTWTNNDSTAHTVTSGAEHGPNSSNISPGETYSFTFTDEGTFSYHCSIHPDMTGSVVVTE